jgi:arabinogalactan endo-1,4-beta-galactosidase
MIKNRWGKALSLALALTVSAGQLSAVEAFAQEGDVTASEVNITNSDFASDIWGSDCGWTVNVSDWESTGASISAYSYSSDQWMDKPSDGSDTGVNYWFGSGAGTLTFSQTIDIPAGTYNFSSEAMGEKSSFHINIGESESAGLTLTGYNNWLTDSCVYTTDEDLYAVTLSVTFDVEKEGWGYINNVTCTHDITITPDPGDDPIVIEPENPEPSVDEPVEAEIYVEKVPGADGDFITGADLSSYIAEKNSGVKFYDYDGNELDDQGFFDFLYDGGVNYVRIRVWNNPNDSDGNGYGGGNCDIEVARQIGLLATNAGMKVLIDFHFSDFWADPGKQTAPKAYAGLSADEKASLVNTFTTKSLAYLLDEGVNVGMVQVGNETNNGVCGEKSWENMAKIFSAGSSAVRNVSEQYGKDILVALHFTNPESSGRYAGYARNLESYGVDYDVFASSYYPYWHGTLSNLEAVLSNIATTYGKKVMVAETSYVTTLEDGDGHGNTENESKSGDAFNYEISVQGQANSVRAVVNTVASIDGGIGVFYWEPAWIPVQVYDENADNASQILAENKELWETYGSGWASSFAGEYDKDAKDWYGGSAVDNEAWFDFTGHPLATARIYSYIRTGTTAPITVSNIYASPITVEEGETITLPAEATVNYSDGSSTLVAVTWNNDDLESAISSGVGTYTINGTATVSDINYPVTVSLTIKPLNFIVNGGFESADMSVWTINDTASAVSRKNDSSNVHSGSYCLHFWDNKEISYYVEQSVTLSKGVYKLGTFLEGGDAGDSSEFLLYAVVNGEKLSVNTGVTGWQNWANPEVTDITVSKDNTTVTIGVSVKAPAGAWGAFDDFYLYKTGDVSEPEEPEEPTEPEEPEEPEISATWVTKWGATYLVTEDSTKLTGFQTVDGKTYYLDPKKGSLIKQSWITLDDNTYYAKQDGSLATNEIISKWGAEYIFDENSLLQTGFVSFEGKDYYCKENGKIVKSDWITVGEDKYYAKSDGQLAKNETITKWFKKYTFDENGILIK